VRLGQTLPGPRALTEKLSSLDRLAAWCCRGSISFVVLRKSLRSWGATYGLRSVTQFPSASLVSTLVPLVARMTTLACKDVCDLDGVLCDVQKTRVSFCLNLWSFGVFANLCREARLSVFMPKRRSHLGVL
jgi:hypothetical protein